MYIKKTFITFISLLLCFFPKIASANSSLSIAFVLDSPEEEWRLVCETMENEITDLLHDEVTLTFSPKHQFIGNNTNPSIEKALDGALRDPKVDLVIAIGPIASHFCTQRTHLSKPTFAPFIIDPTIQQTPQHNGTSGIHNLNYLSYHTDLQANFHMFRQLVPFKTIHLLFEKSLLYAIPSLPQHANQLSEKTGIHIIPTPIKNAEEAIHLLPTTTEAVYVLPLFYQPPDKIQQLASDLIDRKIPSFTLFSQGYTDKGFLISDAPDSKMIRLARRVALNIQQTLMGDNPSTFSTEISRESDLVLNMATARSIGIHPPWEFLLDATVLSMEETPQFCSMNLPFAVHEGLHANRQLEVVRRGVLVGRQEVFRARSRLLPQVEVGSFARIIDKDRAKASRGTNPQTAVYLNSSFSQMVYSNELLGNVRRQAYLQRARLSEYYVATLDTTFLISQSYLNVLREKTLERIERNNLNLTRTNLKVAKQRVRVGAARQSEVYRWESQISENKTRVIQTHFQTENAETEFNRLLNRPQQAQVYLEEMTLCNPYFVIQYPWVEEYLNHVEGLKRFSHYLVCEGLRYAPEIRELDNRIRAQQEALGIATRAFYTPDLFFGGDVQKRIQQSGTASHDKFSNQRTEYKVGLKLTFPLFKGGEKFADKKQAWQELILLRTERQRIAEAIEEQIRFSIQNATASYNAIGLAQEAAETARKNFKLIQEAYAKGSTTIIDLLDAQNQTLNADLVTANAIYDFLIDLMNLQRAIGRFDFDLSEEEKNKWTQQVHTLLGENP